MYAQNFIKLNVAVQELS